MLVMFKVNSKKFNALKMFVVFLLTTMIFVSGIIIGYLFNQQKLTHISELEQNLLTESNAVELQFLLLAENPCVAINSTPLTEELYNIATKLDYMENQLGETNDEVLRLKNYYSTLEIRHYLLLNKMRDRCNKNISTILYFYGRKKECPRCEEQGFLLTYLRKKFSNLYVYAFDVNLNNPALRTLKEIYNIKTVPSIVVNGKRMEGFQNMHKILSEINNTTAIKKTKNEE